MHGATDARDKPDALCPLVVLVPNHTGKREALAPLRAMLEKTPELKNALWVSFDYRRWLCSNKKLGDIARDLGATIDTKYEEHRDEISRIILCGHSLGTAILRRAYLNARGFGSDERVQKRSWAERVDRIVLMGAFGRGFNLRSLPLRLRIPARLWFLLARLFHFGKMRRGALVGADFITRLRVDWIRFNRSNEQQPTIVHLLGSSDEFVNQEDVIDIEQFPTVFPVEVPGATHSSVADPESEARTPLLRAFLNEPEASRDVTPPAGCEAVYFLMHGIRSSKICFEHIARALESSGENVSVIHPCYGYLSMRGFLSAAHRNSHVPWFVDQYAECLARNPSADFYFAGHSNGTYILGEALERIPNMEFKRVYLAGSVLPRDYEWGRVIDTRGQVELVRSDIGIRDWVVGVVARALHGSFWKSIGSSGYDRFNYGKRNRLKENVFPGGHSGMLEGDARIESIVGFLTSGTQAECGEAKPQKPGVLFTVLHKFGHILLPVAMLVALALAVAPVWEDRSLWWVTLGLLLLLWILTGRL